MCEEITLVKADGGCAAGACGACDSVTFNTVCMTASVFWTNGRWSKAGNLAFLEFVGWFGNVDEWSIVGIGIFPG